MNQADQGNNYNEELNQLRFRVWRLEETLKAHGILRPEEELRRPVAERPAAMAAMAVSSVPAQPVNTMPHLDAPVTVTQDATAPSLESVIGTQWFNRIGILAVLVGMAWFLKFAIDNHWIGPLGRVLIGLIAGASLIAWSEHFRGRGFVGFSYSLKAVGSGILYLSLWAAFSLFHLVPSGAAFAAMILVTAFNGYMAWVQDAELLALYAIVGGLSTPLLVSTGQNHEIALFTYLLILDLAVFALVALKPWSRLFVGAFLGTALLYLGWSLQYYTAPQTGRTAFFLTLFFLIFALAPLVMRMQDVGSGSTSSWDKLVLFTLPITTATLGFLAYLQLFEETGHAGGEPWLAVAFSAFYLILQRYSPRNTDRQNNATFSSIHLTAAVVFLTIAIPLKTHGRWLTIGWLVQGAALIWVARRIDSMLLRVLALICLGMGTIALLVVNPETSTTPIFNQRFGTYCVAIAVFAFVAWIAWRVRDSETESTDLSWSSLAAPAVLICNTLALLALGWEIHNFWWSRPWHEDLSHLHAHEIDAQFSYSALFMVYGAALLVVGFARRSAFTRWQALVLLALAIGKVFLFDINQLSQGYRIVSFLGLGALLLTVSYAYQRDWLQLRDREHTTQ